MIIHQQSRCFWFYQSILNDQTFSQQCLPQYRQSQIKSVWGFSRFKPLNHQGPLNFSKNIVSLVHHGAYYALVVHIVPCWCTSTPYTIVVVHNVAWVNPHRQTHRQTHSNPRSAGASSVSQSMYDQENCSMSFPSIWDYTQNVNV